MPATRTQVYLTPDQRRRIDQVARTEGVTLAEVIRRALDAYLADEPVDVDAALAATFGADPYAQLISATPYRNGVVGLYYRPSDPTDPTED